MLAQEELGKALWLYEKRHTAWSEGGRKPLVVERLAADGRLHAADYMEPFVFGR